MKARSIQEMIRVKERIERGLVTPAKVWVVSFDEKGGFSRRKKNKSLFNNHKKQLGRNLKSQIYQESGAEDARTPDAGARFVSALQSRSVWSACVFSAALLPTLNL